LRDSPHAQLQASGAPRVSHICHNPGRCGAPSVSPICQRWADVGHPLGWALLQERSRVARLPTCPTAGKWGTQRFPLCHNPGRCRAPSVFTSANAGTMWGTRWVGPFCRSGRALRDSPHAQLQASGAPSVSPICHKPGRCGAPFGLGPSAGAVARCATPHMPNCRQVGHPAFPLCQRWADVGHPAFPPLPQPGTMWGTQRFPHLPTLGRCGTPVVLGPSAGAVARCATPHMPNCRQVGHPGFPSATTRDDVGHPGFPHLPTPGRYRAPRRVGTQICA
jgi:hypothetical protein